MFNSASGVIYNRPQLYLCGFTSDREYLASHSNGSVTLSNLLYSRLPQFMPASFNPLFTGSEPGMAPKHLA